MRRIKIPGAPGFMLLMMLAPVVALGQSGSSTGGASSAGAGAGTDSQSGDGGGDPTRIPAAVSSGWGRYRPYPYYVIRGTPDGGVAELRVPFGSFVPVMVLPPTAAPAPTAPAPPPGLFRPASLPRRPVAITRADRERAERYQTYGDRMFRVGNTKRAEDRYEQAVRTNPHWAAPRLRLAQVALVRERYSLAADLLREAETAEPGWIVTAIDVQALYPEPADFAEHVAKLEAHLHKNPEDRDAWLVLGAQWFLSRREARAADVFLRLDDPRRKPDVALAAFLDAARLRNPEPRAPEREPFPPPSP